MFYSPIPDLIINWLKKQGSIVYWVWMISCGIFGAISITIWDVYGFSEARKYLAIFIVFWLPGPLLVSIYESHRKKKEEIK